MREFFSICVMSLVLTIAATVFAGESEVEAGGDGVPADGGTNVTVITSDSLQYDAEKRFAVFVGNVVVMDPEMNIKADRLVVVFGDDNSLSSIEADGNVAIHQEETVGVGAKAVYDVEEGKVVLSGNPKVRRLNDELTGEVITFYRGTGRMVCEPNAELRLHAIPDVKAPGATQE